MKKLLLNLSLLLLAGQIASAQDTLLTEKFATGGPDNFSLNPPTGAEAFWINFDGDGLPDGSSGGRPLEWYLQPTIWKQALQIRLLNLLNMNHA